MGVENVLVIKTKIQKSMKQCQNTGTSWWKQTCMLYAMDTITFTWDLRKVGKGN